MHVSALESARQFFDVYLAEQAPLKIIEIGSQDVNGSLREIAPAQHEYIGVDFVEGRGVDLVLTDPYSLPFEDESVDCVVTSSCFEHSEFFWELFVEMSRVVRSGGLIYLNAPSNGKFHRYPVDCFRFYPDSGNALAHWAVRQGHDVLLLESFIGNHDVRDNPAYWNDFVAVFVKGREGLEDSYPRRILDIRQDYSNGIRTSAGGVQEFFRNFREISQDHEKVAAISMLIAGQLVTR